MAEEEGGCETCPLLATDDSSQNTRTNKVCVRAIDYPFKLLEMSPRIEVEVESEEDLPGALTEFTKRVFSVLGRPGVDLHHRAFLRAVIDGRRHQLCTSSWPTPTWAQLIIEQVSFNISGMQPRLLYEDRPWLAQPAIYTQCYGVVVRAKEVARKWAEANKKREGGS